MNNTTHAIGACDLDSGDDYESGVVFTESRMIYWSDNGSHIDEINYADITNVDFDDEDLIVEYNGISSRISLEASDELERYPRAMYSFLMDIVAYTTRNEPK